MKIITQTLAVVALTIALQLVLGCNKPEQELRVDLATGFNGESVILKLDDKVIFDDTISTSPILGFGEILKVDYPIGRTELSLDVDGVVTKEIFRHKENQCILVNLNQTSSKAVIEYPENEMIYD